MKFDHYGYQFLDPTANGSIHSGVDFNWGLPEQDHGLPIFPMADGEIIFARDTGPGWGNLVVMKHPELGVWTRYGHLLEIHASRGAFRTEGLPIALCGNTGGNWPSHLHFDVIIEPLACWTQYTKGWTVEETLEYYVDPVKYIRRNMELMQIAAHLAGLGKMKAALKVKQLMSMTKTNPPNPLS